MTVECDNCHIDFEDNSDEYQEKNLCDDCLDQDLTTDYDCPDLVDQGNSFGRLWEKFKQLN